MLRVGLHGASGRMGAAVLSRLTSGVTLAAAWVSPSSPALGQDLGAVHRGPDLGVPCEAVTADGLAAVDVVLDYSSPQGLRSLLACLDAVPRPLVTGTTGLDDGLQGTLRSLAGHVPVVRAPNTGVGIAALSELLDQAVRMLGPDWDVEIFDLHHGQKADAPSGTALQLAQRAAAAAGRGAGVIRRSRDGRTGPRPEGEVGISAARGGGVVGEHTVFLLGPGERIELTHRVADRGTFAVGGLRAAGFVASAERAAGLYSMADVLSSPGDAS